MRLLTTVRRPFAEWCESTQVFSSQSIAARFMGKGIIIDLDTEERDPECGGRRWAVVAGGEGSLVCEHVVLVGD